jgi:murein DD-endopeptidase MepM/ murein hydrolase activator NlpD
MNDSFGQCSYLWANCHTGEDFSAPSGTPVLAVAAGVVTEAGYDGSYGYKTVITHEDGTETWYAHQTQILVSVGETVGAGEQIGTVGSTGNSTGPHLHLEVRPGGGDPVDPVEALRVRGVSI